MGVAAEERSDLVQLCIRRQLLDDYFSSFRCAEEERERRPHDAKSERTGRWPQGLLPFVIKKNALKCREVAFSQLTETTPRGDSLMWMYYSRRLIGDDEHATLESEGSAAGTVARAE